MAIIFDADTGSGPFPFLSDDDDLKKQVQKMVSPTDPAALPTPPSTPPRTAPGQTTPQTGSLATAPQQAQPKVSGPPMIPGVAARPETLGQTASAASPTSQPARTGLSGAIAQAAQAPGPRATISDLSGRTVTTVAKSALPALRPGIASALAARQAASPAPLNLGPSTLAPQLDAQQQAYGNLMRQRAQYPGPTSLDSIPSGVAGAGNGPAPSLPTTPSTVAPPDQQKLAQDQAKLNYYQQTGSGIDQVRNRWGRGFLRGVDIAGSVIAPGITALVPGTTMHNQMLQGIEQGRIANDQDAIQKAATVADTNSQRAYRDQQAALDAAKAGADAPRPVTREEAAAMGDSSLEGQSWTSKGITATIQVNARNQGLLKKSWDQTVTSARKAGLIATKDENGQVTFAPDPNSAKTLGASQAQRAKDADTYGLTGPERRFFILTGKMHDPQSRTDIHIPSAASEEYNDWKKSLGRAPTPDDLANYRKGNRSNADPTDRDVSTLVGYRKQIQDSYDKADPDSAEARQLKQRLQSIDGRIDAAAEAQDRTRSSGNGQRSGQSGAGQPAHVAPGQDGFTHKGNYWHVGQAVTVNGVPGTVDSIDRKTGKPHVNYEMVEPRTGRQ